MRVQTRCDIVGSQRDTRPLLFSLIYWTLLDYSAFALILHRESSVLSGIVAAVLSLLLLQGYTNVTAGTCATYIRGEINSTRPTGTLQVPRFHRRAKRNCSRKVSLIYFRSSIYRRVWTV